MPPHVLVPTNLPVGSILDGWCVVSWRDRGSYGAVYRARRIEEGAEFVALKLALHPRDERFAREAELLARVHHPGVPHLLARGELACGPDAQPHPYLVMEWVEGAPLYGTPGSPRFTLRGALQSLVQVARALAAIHAASCLHRDVKGGNVLVDGSGRAMLVDFGCGTWLAAPELTEGPLPPGTTRYRSPEALRWRAKHWKNRKRYEATPADDVYALGVMAYRLVTGHYPPSAAEQVGGSGPARLRQPAHALNPAVPLALSALIEQLLADKPKARGTASLAAESLDALAKQADDAAPLLVDDIVRAMAPAIRARQPVPPRRPRLFPIAAVLVVVVAYSTAVEHLHPAQDEEWADAGVDEEGVVGLADAAVDDSLAAVESPVGTHGPTRGLSLKMPDRPLRGQKRAPCTRRGEVAINGGCWIQVANVKGPCGADWYDWKGACLMPVIAPARPDTSGQP